MANRDIIVMGASAGGLPALNRIIKQLPHDLNAAVFIVWHVSPHSRSMLPEILTGRQTGSQAGNWRPSIPPTANRYNRVRFM